LRRSADKSSKGVLFQGGVAVKTRWQKSAAYQNNHKQAGPIGPACYYPENFAAKHAPETLSFRHNITVPQGKTMKKIKIFFLASAFIALFFAGASTVSAQALDNTWFKLHISTKGDAVEMDNENISSISKENVKTTAYLYLWWDVNENEYRYTLHSEVEPGVWDITGSGNIPAPLTTEETIFLHDELWVIAAPDGTVIMPAFSGRITVKLDKSGNLKNATFSTLGAYLMFGMTPEDTRIYGGIKMQGTLANERKLPFVVPR
jgi:hypothetical protein